MKRLILSITLLVTGFAFANEPAVAPNTLTAAEKEAGWRLLFDGEDASAHWRNFKAEGLNAGWKVENGELSRVDKGARDIVTKEQFEAFEFAVDFKISKGGNSGLMFHVTEEEDKPWKTGAEIQIQDNVEGHDPQKAGWLYQLYSAETDATNPVGEWNQIRILITPEKCIQWMNGTKYCEYVKGSEDWNKRVAASKFSKFPNFGKPTKGHICLQDHNDLVSFRNIKIRVIK